MVRVFLSFLVVFGFIGINAQEFHPYKVKSGKITYEKKKYFMQAKLHILSNGTVNGSRTKPSYVEEEVTYYWDNYGDVAYEVAYQVSKFGGKPLPEKVKKYERLWKGDHRYYYDVKKKKISDDPYYTRKACLKAGKLYEVAGCLAVMYPKADLVGKDKVSGKTTNKYNESGGWDFYEWNGIILRDVSYSTSRKGKRKDIDREKVAVKIDTDIQIDKAAFSPKWLRK